jgi:SAM-dependent methyltransferase
VTNTEYYRTFFQTYGHRPEGVGWSSKKSQEEKFEWFDSVAQFNTNSVCDAGCGLGDLYDFILRRHGRADYFGIDAHLPYIEQAKRAYPSGTFIHADIFEIKKSDSADCVIASGVFNFRKENQSNYVKKGLRALASLSRSYIGVNFLRYHRNRMSDSSLLYSWKEAELLPVINSVSEIEVMHSNTTETTLSFFLKKQGKKTLPHKDESSTAS